MALNFDAPVRLTEALLPLLRASAPSAIVNVSSTAARVARPGTGAYSASKFALTGWSDALYAEEHAHGVHVGVVFPGYIATEGFPARELTARRATAWIVSTPERAAEAIVDAGLRRRPERYVPRAYALAGRGAAAAPGARAPHADPWRRLDPHDEDRGRTHARRRRTWTQNRQLRPARPATELWDWTWARPSDEPNIRHRRFLDPARE